MGRTKRQEEEGAKRQEEEGATQQRGHIVVSSVVTAVALVAAGAHLIWPDYAIDGITLAFVGIAIVPWLGPLLESIELPGGFKASFREVKETIQDVKETSEAALSETQAVKETAQEALSETQAVKETAQEALSQTQDVKEAAQAALSRTEEVHQTAKAALSETQAVKETAQAALSRTEEIDKKVGGGTNGSLKTS